MAKFQKGNSYGLGRPKGSGNKGNSKIKAAIIDILKDNIDQVKEDIKTLSPKDRVLFWKDLLKFDQATKRAVEVEIEENNNGVSEIAAQLLELPEERFNDI